MEIKQDIHNGTVEFITYIGGDAYSAPIILKSDGTSQNYLYLHRDYLGSIVAITNQNGNVVEKRLFDAWGEVIKVQDGQGNALNGFKVLDRGYTGHEHLHSVGLIHMNGRLYDAKLHRFLQPDNYIQDPYNTQNYNRYGYVLNNPLKHIDPSGEEAITLTTAVVIGAVIAATTYSIQAGYTYGFQASGWGFLKAVIIGAASSYVTYGIGDLTKTMPFAEKIVAQAFAHGASQAFFTGIQGGDPTVGFASGALSSIASSLWSGGGLEGEWQGFGGNFADKGIGIVAFGTVAGGAGASLTGGNFWRGAVTGLVVSALNHLAHMATKPKTTVAGIYGAGGKGASGNPALKELVEKKGGQMFSSSVGGGDDEIIAYLKAGFEKGNQLEIYGHSRGGAAAVRIANKLGAMHINVNQITLYDPVGMYFGGSFNFDYPNVMKVTNYYQRNPVDGVAWLADNPFKGSPVSGSFQWPAINNVNLTGHYYSPGVLINHINITRYAIKNP